MQALTISGLLEVDVGVPKRAPGDHVPTHSDGEDWPCRRELLKEHRLSNLRNLVPGFDDKKRGSCEKIMLCYQYTDLSFCAPCQGFQRKSF